MTRIFSTLVMFVLTMSIFTGETQAHAISRLPLKGEALATQSAPNEGSEVRSRSECPRSVSIRTSARGAPRNYCPLRLEERRWLRH